MTPVIVGAALALLAFDAAPATSQQPTTVSPAVVAGSAAAANGADDPDRMICKNEALTGSRFTKRICMTHAEWAEQQRKTEDFERRLGEAPSAHSGGGMSGQ